MTDYNSNKPSIMYVKDNGAYVELQKSDLNTTLGSAGSNASASTAFGENSYAMNTPIVQSAPVQDFLPANFRSYTAAGGEGDVVSGEFHVATSTSVGGYGAIQSFRSLNYHAGMGANARFTARFADGGVANSWQGVGLVNLGDELSFGYNGATFGIWHRSHGEAEVRRLDLSAAAAGSETATVTVNGTAFSIPITGNTTATNAYEIERFLTTGASEFTAWQNLSGVSIAYTSDGQKTGTFSYSSDGSSVGSWTVLNTGVTKISDFIPQSEWNIDTKSDLDPTKGNVYNIKYQYLGYGALQFAIENPDTSILEPVHTIKFANANTRKSLGNPALRLGMYAVSLGSTTNINVYSASMAGFIQGMLIPTRNPRSISNVKTVGTSLTNILTIRNKRIVNGTINQAEIEPKLLSVFTESNKGATISIFGNTSVTGPTNFQNTGSSNLISEYDISGGQIDTSIGRQLLTFVIPQNSSVIINLEDLKVSMPPTLKLTIAGKVNSGTANPIGAALVWYEDV